MSIYRQIDNNRWKTFAIFTFFIVFVTGLFYLIGLYLNNSEVFLVLGFLFTLGSSFFSYFYSDKIVLMTVQAHPANPKQHFDFYTVTENLSIAAGLPMPKLYVIDDPAPNAFATGRDPKHAVICATTGLLKDLERGELEGVIAHELAHVKNYDILVMSIVSVLAGTVALVCEWVMRGALWGDRDSDRKGNPLIMILGIVALVLAPLVAMLIQLAISRQREYLADASGALLTRNPEGLARALEKISGFPYAVRTATSSTASLFIENPMPPKDQRSWFQNLFETHPPIEERIQILRSM